jgi:cell division transport system permease protein
MDKKAFPIPFHQTPSTRLFAWVMAFMVYLATLSLVGSVGTYRAIEEWERTIKNGFTIYLPMADKNKETQEASELQRQDVILKALKNIPGVASTKLISAPASPSLDDRSGVFIDVMMQKNAAFDVRELEKDLSSLQGGIKVYDHSLLNKELIQEANLVLIVTLCFALIIAVSCAIIITFSAYSGLVIYEKVIEILRLIGAQDTYIAELFQTQTLKMSLKGGLLGILFSSLTLGLFFYYIKEESLLPLFSAFPPFEVWMVVLLAPCLIMILSLITTRMTILLSIARR